MEPAERLKIEADKISCMILHTDLPWVDIAIQIENLREMCREIDPEHLELFSQVYESRFERLWNQWREN